jgi:hypothetical protein
MVMRTPHFRHAALIAALVCSFVLSMPVAVIAADKIPRTASGKPDL